MSAIAGIISGNGCTAGEAVDILDARQIDDWARIELDYYREFSDGLRFGGVEHHQIEGYKHKPRGVAANDD